MTTAHKQVNSAGRTVADVLKHCRGFDPDLIELINDSWEERGGTQEELIHYLWSNCVINNEGREILRGCVRGTLDTENTLSDVIMMPDPVLRRPGELSETHGENIGGYRAGLERYCHGRKHKGQCDPHAETQEIQDAAAELLRILEAC